MARGINKVTLIGYLGKDPDVRSTTKGLVCSNFSVATNSSWKDKATGEKKEATEWHRVVAFGKLGEIVRDYCRKGKQVYLEGRLSTRKWTDKGGVDRWTTEIIAKEVQMLGKKDDHNAYASEGAPLPEAAPAGV